MKIILVDDEALILDELEYLCGKIEGAEIVGSFQDPAKAVEYVRNNPVEFAFLDIQMPGITGLELLKKLRGYQKDLQAAFVTAYDQYALEAYRNDACDYLLKPFGLDELRHALEKGRRLCRPDTSKGKVEIRTFGRFDVMIEGRAIDFSSRKAKELLALLVARRGGMVETEYAIDLLWEEEPFGDRVKVKFRKALMNLRNTLKENGILWILKTQRGRLYLECGDIECDYFRLLDGERMAADQFTGEFLAEYSWGERYIPQMISICEQSRIPE